MIPSNPLNNSLKPGLTRSPPDDVIFGGSPNTTPHMMHNDDSKLSGSANSNDSLRESRIPVSSAFFSNLYGSNNRSSSNHNSKDETHISDSSLAAGWLQQHDIHDTSIQNSTRSTNLQPLSPSSKELREKLLSSMNGKKNSQLSPLFSLQRFLPR